MYALYLEVATLKAVKIELPSGKIAANVKVTGFNSWGEMTRLFTYDQFRNRFYYVEVSRRVVARLLGRGWAWVDTAQEPG
jgi:hypothetical protein